MSFVCPIRQLTLSGQSCRRVYVPLALVTPAGEVMVDFRFDTGCDVTTVSEDVALRLGLPVGGAPIAVGGATGTATSRLVSVAFRFPPDSVSGTPGPLLTATWAVVSGRTRLSLLSLEDVHSRYNFWTDDADVYFTDR